MFRILPFLFFISLFTACGGSSNQPASNPSSTGNVHSGQAAVVVTDDLTTAYSEVWVTLYSIEASNGTETVKLFDNPSGEVINLAELSGVGSLLSLMSLPSGTYTNFEVTLDRTVTLVTNTGATETHQIASTSDSPVVSFSLTGELVIADGVVSTFALDFDLGKFTINAAGDIVPVVNQMKNMKDALKQTRTKLRGEVQSLTDTGIILLTNEGTEVTVVFDEYTIVLLEDGLALTDLAPGMKVKVFGSVDTETMVITATKVIIDSPDSDADSSTVELEGTITAIDGNALTVDVKHAEFMPESNTLTITITESTNFSRGSADLLALGQDIEVKGTLQADGSITAISVEIEGAGHDTTATDVYAEIKGSVVSLDGTNLTLTVNHVDGLDLATGSETVIDIASAFIKDGTIDDLMTDVMVEIKGTVDDMGTFNATMVEIKNSSSTMDTAMPAPEMPAPVM